MRRALAHSVSDQRVMIVVDSWDAFVEECIDLLPSSAGMHLNRDELERMALRLVSRGTAHLVLVLERPQPSQLDYLVDGIISTTHDVEDTHPERWVMMPKLRGVRIENESYPYTLEGGKFKCIAPETKEFMHIDAFAEPDPGPLPRRSGPVSSAFADAFGRLPLGSLVTIETDDHITDASFETLAFPMMASVLRGGGRVLYTPAPSQRLTEFWNAFGGCFTPDQLRGSGPDHCPGGHARRGAPVAPLPAQRAPVAVWTVWVAIRAQLPKAREFATSPGRSGTAPRTSWSPPSTASV